MATRIRHILVAIHDLGRRPRGQLFKAAAFARAAGASLELFHAIDEPDPGASWPESVTAEYVTRRRAAIAGRCLRRLERVARDASLRGLKVRCASSWDYPPHEAIVRRALASRADLVVAAARHHIPGARFVLRNTDWELIRHCPVPVLLVKSSRPYRRPEIMVAVDPFHAHARPTDLDARLLAAGKSCARLLRGKLHVFHAYMPLVMTPVASIAAAPMVTIPPEVEAQHGEQITRVIDRMAAAAGVPPARRHVQMGDVAGELQAATRGAHTDLAVMGAVSRSALKRMVIGNAAERALDRLECDVLVVKPRGFKTRVARRQAIAPAQPAVVR